MARYKLMAADIFDFDSGEHEVGGQRKKTKKEIDKWVRDHIGARGLEWRVGYQLKFIGCDTVYSWRWIKDNELVKP